MPIYHDFSNWAETMVTLVEELVTGDIWSYDSIKREFQKIQIRSGKQHFNKFRILASVGLEILTKAVCLKRQLDILQKPDPDQHNKSPYRHQILTSKNNPWLESKFSRHAYSHVGDINTKSFNYCVKTLKENLESYPSATVPFSSQLISDIQSWRSLHRNIDCHITVKTTFTGEYEKLREIYNRLLLLYYE